MAIAFVNTISKSGTHLGMRCVSLLPAMSRGLVCPGPSPYLSPDHSSCHLAQVLSELSEGGYFCGHIAYREELAQTLEFAGVRTVLVVRDPRDVLVSTMLWIDEFEEHSLHSFFCTIPNAAERLALLITGTESQDPTGIMIPSIASLYKKFRPWLLQPNSLAVRYENLIGLPGGGTNDGQRNEITRIANHLNFSLDSKNIDEISRRVQASSKAYDRDPDNLIRGKIGVWRNFFNGEVVRLFEQYAGSVLMEWGYK